MRANYFLRTLAAVLLMCWMSAAVAADFTANSEASFKSALEQAAAGDKIVVSGEITLNSTITIDKNVSIVSDSEEDLASFIGNGTKLFVINPPTEENEVLQFKNIGFYEASSVGEGDDFDGGAIRILSGNTQFLYCEIADNFSSQDGGAVNIAGDGTNVLFFDCKIYNNESTLRGGAFYIQGLSTTRFEFCEISSNRTNGTTGESRGGGFFIDNGAGVYMYYSLIKTNRSGWLPDDAPTDSKEGEGGGAFCLNGECSVTLDACSVVGNAALRNGSHGGAFFNMGAYNLTMINTIVAKNLNRGAGSMFNASSGNTLTMVNCNYSENYAYDNAGNGSGIRVMNLDNHINIFNTVIAGNFNTEGPGATDMTWDPKPGIENNLIIKNSLIGLINGSGIPKDNFAAKITDNPKIENKSKVDYYNIAGETAQPDWLALDVANGSGIDFMDGIQTTRPRGMSYYTLVDANAYAAKLGDAALLADVDTETDFIGQERKVASDGSIAAGPLQGVYGEKRLNDPELPSPPLPPTLINNPAKAMASQNIRIIGTVSNGILGIDYGDLKGRAKGELVSLTGQVVEKVFDLNVIGKGYYNVKTAVPGIYILKVTIGGQTYAQRVVLK